jgi:hypothetical protein
MHLPRNKLSLAIIQEIDSASNDQTDSYGFIRSPDKDKVYEEAEKKTEDLIFCPAMGPETKKGVTTESQPLNMFGSGG